MEISGASAVVTGAASGIGAAVARQLAAAGAHVVVADLNVERGEALAREIGGAFVAVDVTNTEQIKAAVEKADELGPLRILVNSAGIGWAQRTVGKDGTFESAADLEAFSRVIGINLIGTFNVLSLAAAKMAENQPDEEGTRGVVVNTASNAAFDGQIGQAAYSASKAGVAGMTLPVARDLASKGIRVVTIAPGPADTPMLGPMREDIRESLVSQIPFPKRLGRAEDFAALVKHIVENEYLNGEVIRLDGALRMGPR